MMKPGEYFKSRGLGYYLTLPVIILALLAVIFYRQYGINIYASAYNSKIYVFCILAMVFALLSMVIDLIPVSFAKEFVRPVRALSFLALLYAVMQYILTQVMFLGAVFVAIDVEQYSPLIPGFALTMSMLGGSTLLAILSTVLDNVAPWNKASAE